MAALKWVVVILSSLGSLAALGLGVLEGRVRGAGVPEPQLVALALRPLPAIPADALSGSRPGAKPVEPVGKAAEPVAKPADPEAKPAEPVAKAAEPVAKPVEPVAKPVEPVAKPAEPVAKPAEPVAKPPPPRPPPAPVAEGLLNLTASDTADVYVDGKKVGSSPLEGFKAKVGTHRVRFDCYDAAGNAVAGPVKTVTVKADEEQRVDFTCAEASE